MRLKSFGGVVLLALKKSFVVSVKGMSTSNRVVIIGGGIHGVSTAYYLAQLGVSSLVIEQTRIAAAASGKAGGFLAREWGDGPTIQLHQKSYDLHRTLATELRVESYRQVNTLEVNGNRKGKNIASWLDGRVSSTLMDTNTSQVTPMELTEKLLEAAVSKEVNGAPAVKVLIDTVEGIERSPSSSDAFSGGFRITGVRTKQHGVIAADRIVICLGPWSGVAVEDWFGLDLPMEGVKSTSLVFSDLEGIRQEPYACFCAEDRHGCHLELYPRPNGELYICGCGGSDHVSGDRLRGSGDCATADLVLADPRRVAASCESLRDMTSIVGDARAPDAVQACMRPCTPDALPVMGRIPGTEGAYISCGHNCWGILWAPVCGKAMAELVAHGRAECVDMSPFTPDRYMLAGDGGKGRGRKKGQQAVGEQW